MDRTARIALEAVIGTDAGQTAVAPGRLLRSWTENERRYFHYATDVPIPLPPGELLMASAPLVDGQLPADAAAWLV